MNRRQFLRCTSSTLAALALSGRAVAQSQPNILFLFADDMTYEALHALGNETIQTPNLDRLVRRGTTFTHAYNQGGWSGAVCICSRSMLNTGQVGVEATGSVSATAPLVLTPAQTTQESARAR